MKATRRGVIMGIRRESTKERWLEARITGPWLGMFSRPSIFGRQISSVKRVVSAFNTT
jgi:hypothetical protein